MLEPYLYLDDLEKAKKPSARAPSVPTPTPKVPKTQAQQPAPTTAAPSAPKTTPAGAKPSARAPKSSIEYEWWTDGGTPPADGGWTEGPKGGWRRPVGSGKGKQKQAVTDKETVTSSGDTPPEQSTSSPAVEEAQSQQKEARVVSTGSEQGPVSSSPDKVANPEKTSAASIEAKKTGDKKAVYEKYQKDMAAFNKKNPNWEKMQSIDNKTLLQHLEEADKNLAVGDHKAAAESAAKARKIYEATKGHPGISKKTHADYKYIVDTVQAESKKAGVELPTKDHPTKADEKAEEAKTKGSSKKTELSVDEQARKEAEARVDEYRANLKKKEGTAPKTKAKTTKAKTTKAKTTKAKTTKAKTTKAKKPTRAERQDAEWEREHQAAKKVHDASSKAEPKLVLDLGAEDNKRKETAAKNKGARAAQAAAAPPPPPPGGPPGGGPPGGGPPPPDDGGSDDEEGTSAKKRTKLNVRGAFRAGRLLGTRLGEASATADAGGYIVSSGIEYGVGGAVNVGQHLLNSKKGDQSKPTSGKPSKKPHTPRGGEVEQSSMKSMPLYLDLFKAIQMPNAGNTTPDDKQARAQHESSYAKRPVGIASSELVTEDRPDRGKKWSHSDEDSVQEEVDEELAAKEEDTKKSLDPVGFLKSMNSYLHEEVSRYLPNSLEVDFMVNELCYDPIQVSKGLKSIVGKDRHRFNVWAQDRMFKSIESLKRVS